MIRGVGLAIVTTSTATAGGKLLEHAFTSARSGGHQYQGPQLRLAFWRRDEYGERPDQLAIVVGFHPRVGRLIDPFTWRCRIRGLRWRLGLRWGLQPPTPNVELHVHGSASPAVEQLEQVAADLRRI